LPEGGNRGKHLPPPSRKKDNLEGESNLKKKDGSLEGRGIQLDEELIRESMLQRREEIHEKEITGQIIKGKISREK